MAKKKQILKKNFYFKSDGSIEFRKMIRGELITGRTGLEDPYKVNKQADEIRHRLISEYYQLKKEKIKKPNINILFSKWTKTLEGLRPSTIRTYTGNANYYIKNGLPIGRSVSRVNSVRRDYNIFARWCKRKGYNVEELEGETETEGRVRVLNDMELKQLWKACDMEDAHWRYKKKHQDFKDCLQFIYYTGARRIEAKAPKKEWLRKNNNNDYYLEVIKKGGKKRIIRVNKQALSILERRKFVFWEYEEQWLTKRYKYLARKGGLTDTNLHDLRRTFGYKLLVSGTDISIVARLLGISIKVAYKHYTPLLVSEIDNFTL
tara:strand:- start:1944 stop:2900 length:957 start_codon:yes stop_codon:yes gene_type:complete